MRSSHPPEEPKTFADSVGNVPSERRKRLRRLVVLILLVSVGIHVVAGIGAGIWVVARYLSQPKAQFVVQKPVQMNPQDREHRLAMEEVMSLRPKPVHDNRIQSMRPSALALPELPTMPMEALVPLDTDALVTDAVEGTGRSGEGSGSQGGFFGSAGHPGIGLLEGTLYDLKQRPDGRPSDLGEGHDSAANNQRYFRVLQRLLAGGVRDSMMRNYHRHPRKLYLGQLSIPDMPAREAPKAFGADIEPRYLAIVYRGSVTPPKTGMYRFAGSADDVLIVRFNNRVVLEASLEPARITPWESREEMSVRGVWGADPPAQARVVYGDWIEMEAGKSYPIEIVLGEVPGQFFYGNLYVQEKDASYAKGPDGKPILPLFRMQVNLPEPGRPMRPVAKDGPIFPARSPASSAAGSAMP